MNEFSIPLRQQLKGTLLSHVCVGGGVPSFFTSQEKPPNPLMCNVEWNHVHLCITFRLDLNGTLPPLTLGSTSPDKLICGGSSLPLPTEKMQRPWFVLLRPVSSTVPLQTPNDPRRGRSRRILLTVFVHLLRTANSCSSGMQSCTQKDLQTTLDGLFQSIQPAGDAYLWQGRKESPLIV